MAHFPIGLLSSQVESCGTHYEAHRECAFGPDSLLDACLASTVWQGEASFKGVRLAGMFQNHLTGGAPSTCKSARFRLWLCIAQDIIKKKKNQCCQRQFTETEPREAQPLLHG